MRSSKINDLCSQLDQVVLVLLPKTHIPLPKAEAQNDLPPILKPASDKKLALSSTRASTPAP